MPCWYYEKDDVDITPSRRHKMPTETEARYRREGAKFIIAVGNNLGLRHNTNATGVVFFHRFYMFHSFRECPRYLTAAACLFLAGKVEETPKKCKDLVKCCRGLLNDHQWKQFGHDPKEEIIVYERILLKTIKFDLQVEHPYGYILKFAKCFKGDQTKLEKVVQMGWTFVNDSLCTTLCLQWEPQILAVSMMYLASRLSKNDLQEMMHSKYKKPGLPWWESFVDDLSTEIMEDIGHQVLDIYAADDKPAKDKSPSPSPPQLKESPVTPKDDPGVAEGGALCSLKKSDGNIGSSANSPAMSRPKKYPTTGQLIMGHPAAKQIRMELKPPNQIVPPGQPPIVNIAPPYPHPHLPYPTQAVAPQPQVLQYTQTPTMIPLPAVDGTLQYPPPMSLQQGVYPRPALLPTPNPGAPMVRPALLPTPQPMGFVTHVATDPGYPVALMSTDQGQYVSAVPQPQPPIPTGASATGLPAIRITGRTDSAQSAMGRRGGGMW